MKKLRILELCAFSAGICGVWTRVLSESLEFSKLGHNVLVFSSNIEKSTNKIAKCEDQVNGIKIKRFNSKSSLFSENVKFWFNKSTEKELLNYNPDIIITHLMHPHSAKISKLISSLKSKNPNLKIFLVPHAPFNVKRKFPLNILTSTWRKFNALKLKKFNKIIAITKWEYPYLKKLGVKEEQIIYIPNGIPLEFFTQKKSKQEKNKDILFLGRIAPVKNLEILLKAARLLPEINFSIVGVPEKKYIEHLRTIISKNNLKNVKICTPIYNLKEKINMIDEHKILVLPSKREAMPQTLIEAMARGKIVISSKTDGGKEIIQDKKTGFLFDIDDYKELAELIKSNIKGNKLIQKNAQIQAKNYSWQKLIKAYVSLFN